jgi:hypothetical protein
MTADGWRICCAALTSMRAAAQVESASADCATFINSNHYEEISMTTNKPLELGKASEETKERGPLPSDHVGSMEGLPDL